MKVCTFSEYYSRLVAMYLISQKEYPMTAFMRKLAYVLPFCPSMHNTHSEREFLSWSGLTAPQFYHIPSLIELVDPNNRPDLTRHQIILNRKSTRALSW
jgi:hypothetical protein